MIKLGNPRVDTVSSIYNFRTNVDILRLDLIDPIISGNKWYKLKEYINEALASKKKTVLTYGGAYSNHIVATAAATKAFGLKSIGLIRGEKPALISGTLQKAMEYGMELFYLSRDDYKNKIIPGTLSISDEDLYTIQEGGYGLLGAKGASQILSDMDTSIYTHIIAATGTGTTLSGLIEASSSQQEVLGISVLKNHFSITDEIKQLISPTEWPRIKVLNDYHFGGYAKKNGELIDFINKWYEQTGIPSDFVYTGKLFFAVNDLIRKGYFGEQSKILVIHSGGLQGNLSLPKGTLIF